MARVTRDTEERPPLVQWRAVFGGAVWAVATLILLSALWTALAFGSDVEMVRENLRWYIAGSAIGSLLLGGYLAGWLSGVRGATAGFVNGTTVWGLAVIATLIAGVPSALRAANIDADTVTGAQSDALWATFWSLLIGMGTAAIGGIIGGAAPRPIDRETRVGTERMAGVHEHRSAEGEYRHEHRPTGTES